MILVFGGAFNGKLGFVKEEFEVSEEDIFYCNEDKINFSKKVICGLHKFTYFNVTKEKSSIEFIKNNIITTLEEPALNESGVEAKKKGF